MAEDDLSPDDAKHLKLAIRSQRQSLQMHTAILQELVVQYLKSGGKAAEIGEIFPRWDTPIPSPAEIAEREKFIESISEEADEDEVGLLIVQRITQATKESHERPRSQHGYKTRLHDNRVSISERTQKIVGIKEGDPISVIVDYDEPGIIILRRGRTQEEIAQQQSEAMAEWHKSKLKQ